MHIPDGFLAPTITLPATFIVVLTVAMIFVTIQFVKRPDR